ncbi:MAG TPA: hydroxymethylbilane synthase [Terriglobia bacterium]|nr:hydroxymethylbilane synthase [Terriglobia bacterium]
MTARTLRLGTRGSALALWQANWTKGALEKRWPDLAVELVPIKTTGDKILDVPLAKIGGKGLFTKEIDEALLDGRIDLAVHSMKDVPFQLPDGIDFGAIPEREDPRDAFISNGPKLQELEALRPQATIGTSSLRRQVQLRHRFPALELVMLRGNVDTRLRKLAAGEFDGIILASAGLKRLGHENRITQILDEDIMLSAVGQGALGIVCRTSDETTRNLLRVLDDSSTRIAVTAERGLLRALGGSCQVPVAGRANLTGGDLTIKGLIASLDGKRVIAHELRGPADRALELGLELGEKLLSMGAGEILAEIAQYGAER